MEPMTFGEIADALRGEIVSGNRGSGITDVTVDSRKARDGVLFVPLTGGARDGHDFVEDAFERGCRAFLVSEKEVCDKIKGSSIIFVRDTGEALQDLAHHYLATLDIKKVAVTGSVGKTSTRDMIYYILSTTYKTMRPVKNFNNEIGVPLTIFGLDKSYEAVVFEEGLAGPGDIHRLSAITRPDVAVITNVGVSHLEYFENRDALKKAKLEVADFLGQEGTLVMNTDCDILDKSDADSVYRVISCGKEGTPDYRVSDISDNGSSCSFILHHDDDEVKIDLPVPGAHNAINASLAIAASAEIGIDTGLARKGLGSLKLTGKRLMIKEVSGIKLIDDSYNAAPESMKSAVGTLIKTGAKRHVAVLAGMNELGADSEGFHRDLGRYVAESGADALIGIGDKARVMVVSAMENGMPYAAWYPDKESFINAKDELLKRGDAVLVKGSNAYGMTQIADEIAGGAK